MSAAQQTQPRADTQAGLDYDVLIIGAGMSGMYQLLRAR